MRSSIVSSAILSVRLRSQSRADVQIHRNGPNPSSKMSPMMSYTYEGYLNLFNDPSCPRMSAFALEAISKKLLPQSQNFIPFWESRLMALTCLFSDSCTFYLNFYGAYTIIFRDSQTETPAGQYPPPQGLCREVWSDPRSTRPSSSFASLSHTSTMFPRKAMEVCSSFFFASFILLTNTSISVIFSLTHPCLIRLSRADSITSAVTEMHPHISPALGWAPLIPPNPEVTYTTPFMLSFPRYFLAAFSKVNVVPCTMPCDPMQQKLPAVICPQIVLPQAQSFSYISLVLQLGTIIPFVMMTLGSLGVEGQSP